MTTDQTLMSAVLDSREAFSLVGKHLTPEDLGPQAEMFWPLIEGWYAQDPRAVAVDKGVLKELAQVKLPKAHQESLLGWFEDLPEIKSAVNVARTILELKRANMARRVMESLAQGRASGELMRKLTELEDATGLDAVSGVVPEGHGPSGSLADILRGSTRENLIPVFPKSLSKACAGGVEPGDYILVFGRPEVGKTLFALNMAAGWAYQGRKVLYLGTEDSPDKLQRRLASRLTMLTQEEMRLDPDVSQRKAEERGLNNVVFWWNAEMSIEALEAKIIATKPDCLILDQIRGLSAPGKGGENMNARLAYLSPRIRALLGRYGLVGLGVAQANDRTQGHNQRPPVWLTMGDLADSRTDAPAQADLLLGIGMDEEMNAAGQRAVSILKNKGEGSHQGFKYWIDVAHTKVYT